jgi:2-dehydropantoate 2-reductase
MKNWVLMSEKIMAKIFQIAGEKDICLSAGIVDEFFMKGKKFPYETKTSFQRDYENKTKPDERDLFGGTVIRFGEKLGIKTETTKLIYDSIQKN